MITTAIDIGRLIVCTPGTCGGRPRIANTRIEVMSIAMEYKAGMTAEQIVEEYENLSLAQVYAALAYYHENKDAIEAEIEAYKADCKYWEEQHKAGKI